MESMERKDGTCVYVNWGSGNDWLSDWLMGREAFCG